MASMLRNVPSVGELLESPPLKSLVSRVSHNVVVSRVGQFLDDLRGQVQGATGVNIPSRAELAERIARWIAVEERGGMRAAINATGILFHPQLGGPPLADEAVRAMADLAAGHTTADLDALTGDAAMRSSVADRQLARLTGAEAAIICNTAAAAGWITLAALATGREAIVARGQVGQLGGCRLVDLAAQTGVTLREVGTTNEATGSDFASAISERTALLYRASAANYAVIGVAEEPSLAEVVALGRRHDLPVIHDLGLGGLTDVARFGLPGQPAAKASLEEGADLVLLAGDKLLGGPACGLVLGKRSLVQRILRHPLLPALQAEPGTLAALLATLRLHEDPSIAERSIPLFSLLATPIENLRNRAERLAPQIASTGVASVEVITGTTTLAGAELPAHMLPTVGLSLTPKSGTAAALAASLRMARPALIGRVAENRVILDLRSVLPRNDVPLVAAVESLARSGGTPDEAAPADAPQADASRSVP